MDISARELKGHNILAVERFWDMGSDRVGAQKMRFPMRMDSPKGTSFTM